MQIHNNKFQLVLHQTQYGFVSGRDWCVGLSGGNWFRLSRQSNQTLDNWELAFYLRKVEELAMESEQLTFAFAASLVWFNFTQTSCFPTRVQLGITLKGDVAFSWMNERAGFWTVPLFSYTVQNRYSDSSFNNFFAVYRPAFLQLSFLMFQSLVLRPSQLT